MSMDVAALRWFQQVADGVTVTQVSEIERVTQSGVSRALARLEAEVGTPLLRRSGRTLRMTHAGVAFKRHVDALVHELDDGLAAVNQLVDPETGTVTLAFQSSLGAWLVPDLVGSFRPEHGDVRFELRRKIDELVPAVRARGQVDLELSTVRTTDPSLRWRRLVNEPLQLAVWPGHRFARRTQIRLAQASDEPFVTTGPTSALRQLAEALCGEAGFAPIVALVDDDLATVRGLVGAGLGVAIVPAPRGGPQNTGTGPLHYLELTDVRAVREIGLAWSAERRLLPAAELFRQHVLGWAASRPLPAPATSP